MRFGRFGIIWGGIWSVNENGDGRVQMARYRTLPCSCLTMASGVGKGEKQ